MGFWNLRAFNLAMLAKQGWRMVQGKDTLLYQCFKARYFPRSSFLEAKESPNCSYVWRSLMAAQPILQSDHCCRVGNGNSVNALKDRWIPNFPTNRILNPVQENWDEIWKLRLPNKIKVFGWRACHEILPTSRNLTRKRIINDNKCSICTRETESTIHSLWDCVAVQDNWVGSVRKL